MKTKFKCLFMFCVTAFVSYNLGVLSIKATTKLQMGISSEYALLAIERQIRNCKNNTGIFPDVCRQISSPEELEKELIFSPACAGKIDVFCIAKTNVVLRTFEKMLSQPNDGFIVLKIIPVPD